MQIGNYFPDCLFCTFYDFGGSQKTIAVERLATATRMSHQGIDDCPADAEI